MTGTMGSNSDDARVFREEVLIGRVTDGEASPSDWAEIESMAQRDPTLWQRLAQSQRAHARLEGAVEDSIAVSEFVDLPRHAMGGAHEFVARWRQYGGWAAAAVVALAWFSIHRNAVVQGGSQQAGIVPISLSAANPDEALKQYLQAGTREGRVVSELPFIMVDASDVPNAKDHEVYFIRPVLERVKATDMQSMRVTTDEHGRPVMVPAGNYEVRTSPRGSLE